MFSATLISGNSARFWKISAVGRLLGPIPAMFWPAILTAPSDGSRKPDTVRKIVVLPQPDGPRKEKNSPPLMSKVALSTAVKSPKRTVTWSSSTPALIALPCLTFFKIDVWLSFYARPGEIKRDQALSEAQTPPENQAMAQKRVSPGEPGLTSSSFRPNQAAVN